MIPKKKKDEMLADEQKDFRNLLRETWVDSRMEKDKSILAISSGAIGLLLTLSTQSGIKGPTQFAVYSLAILAFAVATVCAVVIFGANDDYLEAMIADQEATLEADKLGARLDRLDKILIGSFLCGIICAAVFTGLKTWETFKTPPTEVHVTK